MKVTHFVSVTPNRCGLYATTKDLVLAERLVGIDSNVVNIVTKNGGRGGVDKEATLSPNNLIIDGEIKSIPYKDGINADIYARHTWMPKELEKTGIPIVDFVHGRPESTFLLSHSGKVKIHHSVLHMAKCAAYKAFVTFWDEFLFPLSLQFPSNKVFALPAPVDLEQYSPKGEKHKFKVEGQPNILVCDIWRDDITPYPVVMATAKFIKEMCPTGRLHIFGMEKLKHGATLKLMVELKKAGVLGEWGGLVREIPKIYRAADMLVTPHVIATRTVREALASGCPIVAGSGNRFTEFTANPQDIYAFSSEIARCWMGFTPKLQEKARNTAKANFSLRQVGEQVNILYKRILETPKKTFINKEYQNYLLHQAEKLDKGISWLKKYDKFYYKFIKEELLKDAEIEGASVLCLGARDGTEVRAFNDMGAEAIGIDINPGPNNPLVIKGDFHELPYKDGTKDILYSNCLDHIFYEDVFFAEVARVLKDNGVFLVLATSGEATKSDKYATYQWDSIDDLIWKIVNHGFVLQNKKDFLLENVWFESFMIFKKGKQ